MEHEAAIKLQKVYKSFRTRRRLADCAVLAEQCWWKLIDFAELNHCSISFFDLDKHESATSLWSRAKTRAAKVGKGLSKNGKAQKLALQHWLEAIDPRHRYGHNLHFYYVKWLHSQSKEPFFYWLDIGEGREVNLEKCPRSKLQDQCVKYLSPEERKAYEVVLQDGKFLWKQIEELVHTSSEDNDTKWIFVLSASKVLYIGIKKKGKFQHSSFLAGGATICAGRLVVEHGVLKAAWPHSGHYQPTEENLREFLLFLRDNNVDLSDVKTSLIDDEDYAQEKQSRGHHLRINSSDLDIADMFDRVKTEELKDLTQETNCSAEQQTSSSNQTRFETVSSRLKELEAPKPALVDDGYESEAAEEGFVFEKDHFVRKQELLDAKEHVSKESIQKRIDSKKEAKTYQLGKQLSCRWTSGAGPRIGCVRDYPSELQFRALEKLSLSPRTLTLSEEKPKAEICSDRRMEPCSSQLWRGTSLPARLGVVIN